MRVGIVVGAVVIALVVFIGGGSSHVLSNAQLARAIQTRVGGLVAIRCVDANYSQPAGIEFNYSCFVPGSARQSIFVYATHQSWCVAYPKAARLPAYPKAARLPTCRRDHMVDP